MEKNKFVLSKVMGLTALIYIAGAIISCVLAYTVISDSVLGQSHRNLEAVLESRATHVEEYFRLNQEQVGYLSQNDMILEATKAFTHGFSSIPHDLALSVGSKTNLSADLIAFYEDEFRLQADPENGSLQAPHTYLPLSDAGRFAQWVYLVKNPNAIGSRSQLFSSSYASDYEDAHRMFHPKLNHFLKSFDFRDVFLLDLEGNLIYSTQKEIDFATNLLSGPHSASGLGRAYRGAMAANSSEVVTTDFEPYIASYSEPAAFVASPVFEGEQRIGAVVFQMDSERLNAVASALHGLGESGETYIVGDDLLMRTDSRFSDTSTILTQRVDTEAARESLRGRMGKGIFNDYRGVEVLSHYRPLRIDGLSWGIIAEVDRSDVIAPAIMLTRNTIAVFVLTLGVIMAIAAATLRLCVMRPLSQLLNAARSIATGDYSARVHMETNDEFAVLAESHNHMANAVQIHVAELESALAEVKELQGLLPMCSSCKSIRDGDGYFRTVETYLVGKSKIEFSHTICDDCVPRIYPELGEVLKN